MGEEWSRRMMWDALWVAQERSEGKGGKGGTVWSSSIEVCEKEVEKKEKYVSWV